MNLLKYSISLRIFETVFSTILDTWKSFEPGMRPCKKNNSQEREGVDLVGGHTLTLTECKDMCSRNPSSNALAAMGNSGPIH